MSNELLNLDATGLAELIKKKKISSKEAVSATISRIEEVNPEINAVVAERFEKALNEAEQIDPEKTFAGVPILMKNISQAVKDEKLTGGSRLLKNQTAKENSHFVNSIMKAGFIVIGHTNTPEFGLKNITEPTLYGPTRNYVNRDHSPGGSSGGAAASVAGKMVPLAGASDGGGSIRIPASFSGLIGLKPTRGRTPVGPGAGRQWQGAAIDFALTKSVRDTAALLDEVQTYQLSAAFNTALFNEGYLNFINNEEKKHYKIGFSTVSPVGTPVSEAAVTTVMNLAGWLSEQGHAVEEAHPEINGRHLMEQYYLMNAGEMAGVVSTLEKAYNRKLTSRDMEIESWVLAEAGKKVTAGEFSMSLAAWDQAAQQMFRFHEEYDFYLTPSTAFSAPEIGELTPNQEQIEKLLHVSSMDAGSQQELIYSMFEPSLTYSPFTQLANLTGQPGISLPTGIDSLNLPIGVQLMTAKGEEHLLLKLASEIEKAGLFKGPINKD
ncbi:amidase [Jeotgalibacillus proteolyticus]|uniref:Amidase n=1 Tax=Jeotgalibacillus proteolyticus TaxID=2082395 RepID=A0A2S5GG51_9BACL|nr:amidase [Jeotgalibacillus proteolyticus]